MKVALTGGAYQAHSVVASAQRCLNLIQEPMPENQGEPMPSAAYPTPGTTLLGTIGTGPIRGIRQCTTGGVYVVSGDTLYSVDVSNWTGTALGSITPGLRTPVSMQDNGLNMIVVDGTANGWDVTLAGNTMAQISDPSGMFSGADRVDYLDTYFLFNKPATPQFYISGSLATTFDQLDFANKEAYSDLLVTVVVAKRLVYLFGERTTEIWYDAGATDIGAGSFPFAAMQSEVFIDHGIVATYSPAVYDNSVFWLTRDRQGQGIVMMVAGYQTKRVSTYAIEAEIAGYDRINDAIGFCYQLAGHSFYVLTFPYADKTWSYDITTGLWHEWLWIDTNGAEHRHRANCFWPVNDTLVVGDWQVGNLYALDNRVFTDNGQPIKRVRTFPHMLADGKRVFYRQFLADLETGNAPLIAIAAPAVPTGFHALPMNGSLNGAANGISADGNTVVGFVCPAGDHTTPRRACYWLSEGSPVIISPDNDTQAFAASADGLTIIGGSPTGPFRWTASGGLVPFGTVDDTADSISGDASRIVGGHGYALPRVVACYWDSSGTRTDLGFLPGCDVSEAFGVSADGSVIVGTSFFRDDQVSTQRAWRWTAGTGMVSLGVAGTGIRSRGFSVSGDGAVVVGGLIDASGHSTAFRWTAAGGMVQRLDMVLATAISGDGSTTIGQSFNPPGTSVGNVYLGYTTGGPTIVPDPTSNPTDPGGANGTYPAGVSADGETMVGFGHGTNTLPWIYHIAVPVAVTATTSVNLISLETSDDRGHSFGSPVSQAIGDAGEYRTSLQWQRLGMARDRVFRLSWSTPMATALQGAWIDVTPAQS